ncbi:MAG: hypothetical protein K0S99_48, partial [Thermomicrobiales bacterium]|nr:hypothetical protein [Thermomicrobiales bacterium]
ERLLCADGLDPVKRLAIHQRNFASSLNESLASTYPLTCRLVDPRFFAFAADGYLREAPPERPCLFEFGDSFPEYLSKLPSCAHLPWLADFARLEWVIHAAFHAPDTEPLGWAAMPLEFKIRGPVSFRPCVRHLATDWAVHRLWQDLRQGRDGSAVELASPARLLVWRDAEDEVCLTSVGAGEFAIHAAIAGGIPLLEAMELGLAQDPSCNIAAVLRRLFECRLLTAPTFQEQARCSARPDKTR